MGTGVSAAVMTTAVVDGTVDVGATVVVDSASTTERNESSSPSLPSAPNNGTASTAANAIAPTLSKRGSIEPNSPLPATTRRWRRASGSTQIMSWSIEPSS